IRWVMVRVLPVPAPARMQTGPVTTCAPALCSSSSASSTASARESGSVPGRTGRVCVIGPPSVLAADVRPPDPVSREGRHREASPGDRRCPAHTSGHSPGGWTGFDRPGRISSMSSTPTVPVTMYTTPWCGYCVRLKKLMQREGIPFAEGDIEQDAQAADLVMNANGGNRTVPTLLFADGVALTNPTIDQVKAQLASPPEA